jgi:ATP-dependent RNA helicase DDX19/DBP5
MEITTLINARDGFKDLPAEMVGLVVSQPESETQVVEGASNALTVVHANTDCGLVACKTWEELNLKPLLLKALYETMAFRKPVKIREVALPPGLRNPALKRASFRQRADKDGLWAFSLIMVMRVNEELKHTQAVWVALTYELVPQSASVCRKMGEGIGVSVLLATSDKRSCPKFKRGEKCTNQIVIGTPGKINALLKSKVIDGKKVGVFVLDEADEMVK